jgi:hypothetical protein
MAEHCSKFPLARTKRKKLEKGLTKFSDEVDTYLRDPDNHSGMSRSIKDYSAAVERAASDLARRKTRRAEVAKVVVPIVS